MRIAEWANLEFPIPNSEIEKWGYPMARIRFANGAPPARGDIYLPAIGRRTSSSLLPFSGVYLKSYKFGCERVRRQIFHKFVFENVFGGV